MGGLIGIDDVVRGIETRLTTVFDDVVLADVRSPGSSPRPALHRAVWVDAPGSDSQGEHRNPRAARMQDRVIVTAFHRIRPAEQRESRNEALAFETAILRNLTHAEWWSSVRFQLTYEDSQRQRVPDFYATEMTFTARRQQALGWEA